MNRSVAKRILLSYLSEGHEELSDDGIRSWVTPQGTFTRVCFAGTVISSLKTDSGFVIVHIDDGTSVISCKGFDAVMDDLASLSVGDIVQIVGKVRDYNGEPTIISEIVTKIEDPNIELLRHLEAKLLNEHASIITEEVI